MDFPRFIDLEEIFNEFLSENGLFRVSLKEVSLGDGRFIYLGKEVDLVPIIGGICHIVGRGKNREINISSLERMLELSRKLGAQACFVSDAVEYVPKLGRFPFKDYEHAFYVQEVQLFGIRI